VEPFRSSEHERSVAGERSLLLTGSDDSLWRATADGDPQAFAALYERHARAIYNYLFRRLADWSEAEDLTAVVFLEAFRRRREVVVHDGKLLPWLYGIATNVLRNRRRALWRNRKTLERLALDGVADGADDLAARAEAAAEMRTLLRRIAELPEGQQDVVALCIWSGLSYDEAAVALGVPVGTIRSRLSRARAALVELRSDPRHGPVDVPRVVKP
jgi:RNA polymerase sigma-70 factor (ECF subfamily)